MGEPEERKITITPGTPRWITEELIADTLRVWQPYYKEALTVDDAVEILVNVTNLFEVCRSATSPIPVEWGTPPRPTCEVQ